ncbi:hypothetical protein ElyMa_002965500 [Elysia marginata]|uniref:Endonuclease/exonuclease/phosphatase domain-containing protein n=1 Tax=Elysia marginata TaxID=1093978 RepID=A0AAV4I8N5_9GAST|nr:hypothetical protein ElyMa_002965500 [Elysia marginata]
MGDFNGKAGQRRDSWTKHLGPFSDNTEYFYDLLNPAGILDTGEGFDPSQPDHQEPNILESEVRWAVKDSPKDKAAGDDGITTRAVLACGEIGFQWLTLMFQRAWEERKVPDDWQRAIVVPI